MVGARTSDALSDALVAAGALIENSIYLWPMAVPPPMVLCEFGAASEVAPLAGGQGSAWRAGDLVLKPLDMSLNALEWQADVLAAMSPDGFRVAAPLRSRVGALVVEGWTAWPALTGAHATRWDDIIAVGGRFHDALANVERPAALLDARTDVWADADRIAWGEMSGGDREAVSEVARLLSARRAVHAPSQLVHGDLSGNVLFADGLAPAVTDFSPYWRPKGFASAVVAADAVLFHHADIELLSRVVDARDGPQLLIRALLFRLLAHPDPAEHADVYRPGVDYVTSAREFDAARGVAVAFACESEPAAIASASMEQRGTSRYRAPCSGDPG